MRVFLLSILLFFAIPAFVKAQEWLMISNKAVEYFQNGDFDSAINYGQRAIDQFKKDVGQENNEYAFLYANLALYFEKKNQFEDAIESYLEAIRVYDVLFGMESEHHYYSYNGISFSYFQRGDFENAQKYSMYLASTAKKFIGPESAEYEQAIHRLAWSTYRNGNLEEAEAYFLNALELRKTIYGTVSTRYLNIVKDIREFYVKTNQVEKAISFFEREREVTRDFFGEKSNQHHVMIREFADYVLKTARNVDRAFELHNERIAILETLENLSSVDIMNVMVSLARDFQQVEAYDKSVFYHRKIKAIVESIYGTENENYAVAALNLGYLLHYDNQFDEAILWLKEAVRVYRLTLGDIQSLTIQGLEVLTQVASKGGFDELALETNGEMLAAVETRFGKNHTRYTTKLVERALFLQKLNRIDEAISHIKQAISIEDEIGDRSRLHHQYYTVLGGMLLLTRSYDEAEEWLQRGLQYAEKTHGISLEYASVLDLVFSLELARGNFLLGKQVAETKLEIFQQKMGSFYIKTIQSWNDLGLILNQLQLYDDALKAHSEAAQLAGNFLGTQHPEYLKALNGQTQSLENSQRFDLAEELITKVLEIQKSTLGPDHPDVGGSLITLGRLFMGVHDYEEAIEILNEAHLILEPHQETEYRNYALVLYLKGFVYAITKNVSEAIGYSQQAFEIRSGFMIEDHPDIIESAIQLGNLYETVGNLDQALEWYENAYYLSLNRYTLNHTNTAAILRELGSIYLKKGDLDSAVQLFERSISINDGIYGENNLNNLGAYSYLGRIYRDAGDFERMDFYNAPVIKNYQIQALQQLSYLSESRQEQFFRFMEIYNDMYISQYAPFAVEHPEAAARILEISMFNKGLRLRSSTRLRSLILESNDEEILEMYDNWMSLRAEIQVLLQQPESQRGNRAEEITEKAEELERQLMSRSRDFQNQFATTEADNWESIKTLLGDDEAVVEFLTYFEYDNELKRTDNILNAALILQKNEPYPTFIPLGSEAEIQELLDRDGMDDSGFISGLYRQIGGAAVVQFEQIARGKQLYSLLWEPIEAKLSGISTVYFSPSGTLNQIAFAAIPKNDDNGELLSDRYRLRQIGTISRLADLKQMQPQTPTSIKLFGGIDYDTPPAELLATTGDGIRFRVDRFGDSNRTRGGSWTYLAGTLHEVNQIHEIASAKNISVELSKGTDALETRLKALSGQQSPDVIHIATHGFFFNNPEVTVDGAELSWNSGQTFFQQAQNPLNRSGLLFAGANYAWSGNPLPEGLDDGIFTAYEVSNMFLPNTQLVVLSACETGLGDIRGSEGVFGLQRAFRMAGVQNLLMSLWEVPDAETAEFMVTFYENWLNGTSISDAFHATQNHMKSRYPNEPFKWAAFVLLE